MARQKLHSCENGFSTFRKAVATIFLIAAGLGIQGHTETAQSQEIVINITGIPGVLPSPFLSDLEDDLVSGRYQGMLNYSPRNLDMSAPPVEVAFHVRLYHNRELLVDERSLPAFFEPGPNFLSPIFDRIEFESSLEDVLSGVRSSLQRQMIQTGALPEGDYRLELDAEVLSGEQVRVVPGVALFSVTYPPPPQLITPGNRTNVAMGTPVFSWSPVLTRVPVSLEYEFLLVQMFDGQGPEDAIDANRPHHEQTLMDVTSFVYTPDLFPLESGQSYAWMVRAFGAGEDVPVRNDGESEIFTFTYDESPVKPEDIANLQEIPLVPGLARLINLGDLEVDDAGMFYELNGRAEVEFTMDGLTDEPIRLSASVRGLTIQQTGLENPVIAGGEVDMRIDPVNEILQHQRSFLTLDEMHFRF